MEFTPEQFEEWGFRWPRLTTAELPDGRQVTIEPTRYHGKREWQIRPGPARRILREYTVRLPSGLGYALNEYRVEQLLGLDEPEAEPES
jgi:hypothetical protein